MVLQNDYNTLMCFERVGVLGAKSEGYFGKIGGSGKAAVERVA